MKKFLALVMAMMMVLAMGTAFAEEYEDQRTKNFTKTYTVVGEGAKNPGETFSVEHIQFVSAVDTGVGYTEDWAKNNLPQIDTVTYAEGETGDKTFTVTLPTNYPSVGIYTYSFNEVDGNVSGVTYNTTTMRLVVTVVEESGLKRIAAIHCEGAAGGTKTDKFTNTYSAGKLTVNKTVDGELADTAQIFDVKVTFTPEQGDEIKSTITITDGEAGSDTTATLNDDGTATANIKVKHGTTVTFANVPAGVIYEVEETSVTGYTATYENESGTIEVNKTSAAKIVNTKGGVVDTGMFLDNAPYMMIMALVVLAGVAMMMKRRAYND